MAIISDAEKSALYYSASSRKVKPEFVPATVNIFRNVKGEFPFLSAGVDAGVVECTCNRYGAVTVIDKAGKEFGLRLNEFVPVTWRENLTPDHNINQRDLEKLKHMLGAEEYVKKSKRGYRNFFAAGKEDMESMERLLSEGLVIKGPTRNEMTFFFATEKGCIAAGLHKSAIKRAMEG